MSIQKINDELPIINTITISYGIKSNLSPFSVVNNTNISSRIIYMSKIESQNKTYIHNIKTQKDILYYLTYSNNITKAIHYRGYSDVI
jgi:hypothetical protein